MKTTVPTALLIALLAGACGVSVGPQEGPSVTFYHIALPPPLPAANRLDVDIVLMPFAQAGALDRDGIRYRTSDVEGGYFADHRWAEPVGAMVRDAVQTDLERSGQFRRVLLLDQAAHAQVTLTGEVIRWEEVDREDGWHAVVEIDFDLVLRAARDASVDVRDRIVLSRRYRAEERAADSSAPEVVRGLTRALATVLADLRKDMEATLTEETR